jgi:hypothetical protein
MSDQPEAVVFTTHSDDCASIVGRNNIDESSLWGKWWPLVVDGQPVGEVMVDYGDGWEFHLCPLDGHTLDVIDDPALLPEEERAWWDEDEDD